MFSDLRLLKYRCYNFSLEAGLFITVYKFTESCNILLESYDKCYLSCFIHFYGRTMFRGIELLPKILTLKTSKAQAYILFNFFLKVHIVILHTHTKAFVEFCISVGAMNFFNFICWLILVAFQKFPKILTYTIKMTTSNFPQIFSEGSYDHPIHPYQVACRVLYWFRCYEFFNLIFWRIFQKCWPKILKWLGIWTLISPNFFMHQYQVVCRGLYWFSSYEFFN